MGLIIEPRNCKECGKVFTYTGGSTLCEECRKKDNQEFGRIKDYLWEHPNSSVSTVSAELGISVMKIRRYIKEERVEVTGIDKTKSYCHNCYTIISLGTYCPACEKELSKTNRAADIYVSPKDKQLKPKTDGKNFIYK